MSVKGHGSNHSVERFSRQKQLLKMLLICSLVFGWSAEENTLVYVEPSEARVSAWLTWFLRQQLSVGFGLKLATFETHWPLWEPSSDHPKGRYGVKCQGLITYT